MDAVNVFLPARWTPEDIDATECNRRSAFSTFDSVEDFGLLEPHDLFELSVERRSDPGGQAAAIGTKLCLPAQSDDGLPALNHNGELYKPFAQAYHRRVRSASVFLPSSAPPGIPSLVPQLSDNTRVETTLSMADLVPPHRWIEGAAQAKRHCCWDRESAVPINAESHEETNGNESLMSRMSSCTAALDTEIITLPAAESSPLVRSWPSRFSGLTSPFAVPKVYSLDETSLAMLNQRLQASSDQFCSHPQTPPKQVQTPRTMVLSPPMLLRADSSNESSLPGIRITRIPSGQTPKSCNADASPCIVSPER